jgi:hypothetical protein
LDAFLPERYDRCYKHNEPDNQAVGSAPCSAKAVPSAGNGIPFNVAILWVFLRPFEVVVGIPRASRYRVSDIGV